MVQKWPTEHSNALSAVSLFPLVGLRSFSLSSRPQCWVRVKLGSLPPVSSLSRCKHPILTTHSGTLQPRSVFSPLTHDSHSTGLTCSFLFLAFWPSPKSAVDQTPALSSLSFHATRSRTPGTVSRIGGNGLHGRRRKFSAKKSSFRRSYYISRQESHLLGYSCIEFLVLVGPLNRELGWLFSKGSAWIDAKMRSD